MSLVPYDFYEECFKMAKQPSLSQTQKEWIEQLAKKYKPRRIIISSPRRAGKTHMTLELALKQAMENKKKESNKFVFR